MPVKEWLLSPWPFLYLGGFGIVLLVIWLYGKWENRNK